MVERNHFDKIAHRYDQEIPEHIRLHLLERKITHMMMFFPHPLPKDLSGLDCGCGTGQYMIKLAQYGAKMHGLELSEGMRQQAMKSTAGLNIDVKLGSIMDMPYEDGCFDFCYSINVLHHLSGFTAQLQAIEEMIRVVRPGGFIFIQDFNADSLATRLYMHYVFPLTSVIDDDETEIWISPKLLAKQEFLRAEFVCTVKFTFLPNFIGRKIFPAAKAIEAFAEKITRNRSGAHFLTAFRRLP